MNKKEMLLCFLIGTLSAVPGLGAQEGELKEVFRTMEELSALPVPQGGFKEIAELAPAPEYRQFDLQYTSDGLKIYGLLTVPKSAPPPGGYPAILFIHGYVPPAQWSTVKSYATYQPPLARAGFITFKPDLRGHGRSEGRGTSHFSDDYTRDVLAALGALKTYPGVNPDRIGYWGHSNGGKTGLRLAVSRKEIKAYSLWAGVVGSYTDMLETWNEKIRFLRVPNPATEAAGLPGANPGFWNPRDPHLHLNRITAPMEVQHAAGDASVPVELSRSLTAALRKAEKAVTYWEYPGDNHNINRNYTQAWARTVEFFRKNL